MGEARNALEGTLSWVQASGSGKSWLTASAPASGTLGFVENFRFTSALTREVIMERGIPSHHKLVSKQAIPVSFDVLWANTAEWPYAALTASGSTTPMVHLELKMTAPETPALTGNYYMFFGWPVNSLDFTETTPANRLSFQGQALGMLGPTASGYIK